jgi:hypothetical protein
MFIIKIQSNIFLQNLPKNENNCNKKIKLGIVKRNIDYLKNISLTNVKCLGIERGCNASFPQYFGQF